MIIAHINTLDINDEYDYTKVISTVSPSPCAQDHSITTTPTSIPTPVPISASTISPFPALAGRDPGHRTSEAQIDDVDDPVDGE